MPKRKVLKVIVEVTFKAVTCPGVVLPDQASVFLHVEVLGERKRSKSLPAVFPFLFHEKMKFEKVFHQATDPVHVTNELSTDVVQIELIQLSYPDGELLACYNENAREFLFPTPKITRKYPGVDREVLFCRTGNFPGIAPKLEFSSRTIIKEINTNDSIKGKLKSSKSSTSQVTRSTSPLKKSLSSEIVEKIKPRKSRSIKRDESKPKIYPKTPISGNNFQSNRRYQQSTISSRARSPSPYTRRRMAQLSVSDPFDSAVASRPFRTELEDRPDFVVRKSDTEAKISTEVRKSRSKPKPTSPASNTSKRRSKRRGRGVSFQDFSANGSYLKDEGRPLSAPETHLIDYQRSVDDLMHEDELRRLSILERKPLSDRYFSNESSSYNEIRDRIRHLLNTPVGDFQGRSYEAMNRERQRAISYTSRLSPSRVDDVTASSFEQRIDQAYEDMYKSLNSN